MKKKKFKPIIIDFKKYRGRQIAIVNGKIVADGYSTEEAFKKAEKLYPKKKFWLFSVPREKVSIYS